MSANTDPGTPYQDGGAVIIPVVARAAGGQVLSAGPRRRVMILSPDVANLITFGWGQVPALGQGLNLHPKTDCIVLTRGEHGNMVTGPLFAIAATADTPIGIAVEGA